MLWFRSIGIIFFIELFLGFLNAEVSFYVDNECAHVLLDNFEKDRRSLYDRKILSLINKKEFDCWEGSSVRTKTLGKLIDEERVFELLNWILLEDVERDWYVRKRRQHVHIEASELHPCMLIPIYEKYGGRPILAVGTERGYIDAAVSKASKLYLVDNTPDVVVCNYIIDLLLKVSESRLDYLYLRKEANCEEWVAFFEKKGINVRGNARRYVPYLWEFWVKNVRLKERYFESIEVNNTQPVPYLLSDSASFHIDLQRFANVNYLYDEELFSWVKSLADKNKIFIYLADVSDRDQLKEVIDHIYPEKFGIIDLSNVIGLEVGKEKAVFRSRYLNESGHQNCFRTFGGVADEETRIVWTSYSGVVGIKYGTRFEELKEEWGGWVYRSASLLEAIDYSLGDSVFLDVWESERTDFEGCRVDMEEPDEPSIMEKISNFVISFTEILN